jgi:hypothetical protein
MAISFIRSRRHDEAGPVDRAAVGNRAVLLQEPYNEQNGIFRQTAVGSRTYPTNQAGTRCAGLSGTWRKVPISTGGGSDVSWRGAELFTWRRLIET